MSLILSINSGIGSSIGVFRDGVPQLCVEEERFNRVKNWMGFPEKAFQHFIDEKLIAPETIDWVVLCDTNPAPHSRTAFYKKYEDYFQFAVDAGSLPESPLKYYLKKSPFYGIYKSMRSGPAPQRAEQVDAVKNFLVSKGFSESKILRVDHHLCHAASAYYGLATSLEEKYLVFTLDGGGDRNLTSTVSVASQGKIEKQSESACYSIGNMYSAITHFLGFTPHEHEYKLMGLAPYVNPKYAEQYRKYFEQFLSLKNDDTEFYNPMSLSHVEFFGRLIKDLKKARFDNIAAGMQAFTEEIVTRWIKGNIKKHGVKKILCAGGVFMNVKLNKILSTLAEVDYMDVFPSCGDESNIFGAAFYTYNERVTGKVGLLNNYTLGTMPGKDIGKALQKFSGKISFEKLTDPNKYIAEQLAANKIVARCSGNMEFGARSLGNRSILANPDNLANVNKINQSVKKRDFWMPFAPAMLWEKADTMIKIPASLKKQGSPYMMFAFDTVESMREKIICGVHQADFTARTESISADRYPDFHAIISNFNDITGIPCVLNTSFNLHGFPVVENVDQAVEVLLDSKIDLLVIENYAIQRR